MKKISLTVILILCSSLAHATSLIYGTTYAPTGQVTSTNLNGNFSNVKDVVNGGLDNGNADTTDGYRFYETKATLPSSGTQGRVIYLTADNTLNFDTGSSFLKSVAITSTSIGTIPYYNSGWTNLDPGTISYPLVSNGAGSLPSYKILPSAGGGTGADLSGSAQGVLPYFSATSVMSGLAAGTTGQVLKTQGASANPIWVNSLSSVLDYGTSASSSTSRQATTLKVAYGTGIAVAGGNSANITNLTFSSSSSYAVTCTASASFGTPPAGTDQNSGNLVCVPGSGTSFTIYNTDDQSKTVQWIAVGT